MTAFYADALDTATLKQQQGTIAMERAAAQAELSKFDVSEQLVTDNLDNCLELLASAHQHYNLADDNSRRDLNQSVFGHMYVHDDEVIASDLTPAFRRLISDSLNSDLGSERKQDQTKQLRTLSLYAVPEVSEHGLRGGESDHEAHRPLPIRARRTAPDARLGGLLTLERPRGALPWEKKEPRPSKDRGSKERFW